MKHKKIVGLLTAAIVAFLPTGQVFADMPQETPAEEQQYIMVADNEAAYEEAVEEIGDNITVETPVLSENNVIVAELDEKEVKEFEQNDNILIEEDFVLTANALENDGLELSEEDVRRMKEERIAKKEAKEEASEISEPEYDWNIQAVNAEGVSGEETQTEGKVKVAVLDSGVDYVSGVNLKGFVNLVEEEDYLSEMFQDLTGHGTGIAGIISGNGESGVYGVNPNAEVYSVRVLDKDNKAPLSRIIRGIYWCIENGIHVINMSFGTPIYSKALELAVKDAYAANILMVGAAGNEGSGVEYPAAFEEVMAVAASDTKSRISEFSNTGEELEIAAPGEKIRTTGYFNGCVVTHGTSIAVPHVVGAASLLWEKDLSKSNSFIRELITKSAKDMEGTDECGLLDVNYALNVYDDFAENFSEEDWDSIIPENVEDVESFEYVDDDENYVEGRWGGTAHNHTINYGVEGLSFSSSEIQWLKDGINYPDQKWRADNPTNGKPKFQVWHGYWKYRSQFGYRVNEPINYVAIVEMVTTIALKGGDPSQFTNYKNIMGMDSKLFEDLKSMLQTWYNSNSAWEKRHRVLFLYGCGLHTMTDLFSHSSADRNNVQIVHNNGDKSADTTSYYVGRYEAAKEAVKEAMKALKNGTESDGYEIMKGLNRAYQSNSTFHLINLKKNITENGYDSFYTTLLNKVNVDNKDLK